MWCVLDLLLKRRQTEHIRTIALKLTFMCS